MTGREMYGSDREQAERMLDRIQTAADEGMPLDDVRIALFDLSAAIDRESDLAPIADRISVLASALGPDSIHEVIEMVRALVAGPVAPAEAPAEPEVPDDVAAYAADQELGAMFVAEGLDHLATIESTILQLETSPDDVKLLNDVFRPFHTVKGNAGVLGLMSIQEVAHKLETLLDRVRSGTHAMGPAEVDVVLKGVDLLTLMIRELPARAAGHVGTDVTRRRADLLDVVTALIEGGPSPAVYEPAAVAPAVAAPGAAAPKVDRRDDNQSTVKVNTRKLDALLDMVGELVIAQSILAEDPVLVRSRDERLNDRLAQLKRITSELQRNAMAMRMVPIRQTFQKMARLVRDMSRQSDKPISLVL